MRIKLLAAYNAFKKQGQVVTKNSQKKIFLHIFHQKTLFNLLSMNYF